MDEWKLSKLLIYKQNRDNFTFTTSPFLCKFKDTCNTNVIFMIHCVRGFFCNVKEVRRELTLNTRYD